MALTHRSCFRCECSRKRGKTHRHLDASAGSIELLDEDEQTQAEHSKDSRPASPVQAIRVILVDNHSASSPSTTAIVASGTPTASTGPAFIRVARRAPGVIVARPSSTVDTETAIIPTPLSPLEWVGH